MALGYGEGSIAGIALTFNDVPVQAILIGGANLKVTKVANTQFALNGNPQTQVFNTGIKGAKFAFRFPHMPRTLIDQIIIAVEAALTASETFVIVYDDGVHELDLDCTVDNGRGEDQRGWIEYGDGRVHQEFAPDVVMRFIAVSSN